MVQLERQGHSARNEAAITSSIATFWIDRRSLALSLVILDQAHLLTIFGFAMAGK